VQRRVEAPDPEIEVRPLADHRRPADLDRPRLAGRQRRELAIDERLGRERQLHVERDGVCRLAIARARERIGSIPAAAQPELRGRVAGQHQLHVVVDDRRARRGLQPRAVQRVVPAEHLGLADAHDLVTPGAAALDQPLAAVAPQRHRLR
jgi:hypothetical protein